MWIDTCLCLCRRQTNNGTCSPRRCSSQTLYTRLLFFFFFSLRDQLPSSLPLRKRLNKPKLCPHHLWVHYSCMTAHFVLHFVSLSGMLMVKQSLVIHVLQICHLPMSKYLFLHFLKIYFSIILSKSFDFFKCQLLLLYLICFFF